MNIHSFTPILRREFRLAMIVGAMSVLSIGSYAAELGKSPTLESALQTIRSVGPEGAGNGEASAAWRILASRPTEDLPVLLAGMDGANDFAVNWINAAVDSVTPRGDLPIAALGEFLFDTSHHPRSRYRAFKLIVDAQPRSADSLLAGMLADPGAELRYDAVDLWIRRASAATNSGDSSTATLLYRQALTAARDAVQIDSITEALRELGQTVDLPNVFGFLMNWQVIGPFDNTDLAGFEKVFEPEKEIRIKKIYQGKSGPVKWISHASSNEHGIIDLNKALERAKGVTGYATTRFDSEVERQAELRLGCKNAWKIWLNDEFIFGRDEYHMGSQIDQYRLPVTLRPGANTILIKLCQDERMEDWTEEWEFQLRITDTLGTPIRQVTKAD